MSFRVLTPQGDNDKNMCETRHEEKAVAFVLCGTFIILVRMKCIDDLQTTSSVISVKSTQPELLLAFKIVIVQNIIEKLDSGNYL